MKFKLSFLIIFMLVIFSGCSLKDKLGSNEQESSPVSSVFVDETFAMRINDKVPLHLYYASNNGNTLSMEVRYIPLTEAKKSVPNLAGVIVKEIIAGPTQISGLKPTLEKGTKLISEPTFKDGTITVNLSKEFISKFSENSDIAKLSIYSIVNSLTEVKEIERVKFLIDGEIIKDVKVTVKLDSSLIRNPSLIGADTSHKVIETSEMIEVLD